MFQEICWYMAIICGFILFVSGIAYLIYTKGTKEEHFAKATVIEFIGVWVMYIPYEMFNDSGIPDTMPVLTVIESLLLALVRTFSVYMGNGLEKVSYYGHPVFTGIYSTLMTGISVVLILFMVGIIIKIFNGFFQKTKLKLRKKSELYILSDSNLKCLSIAKSIRIKESETQNRRKEKRNIVFANYKDNNEIENKQKIHSIEGIFIEDSVEDVVKLVGKSAKKTEVFLFGDKEEKNLEELENLCALAEREKNLKLRVYIELSDTPWELYQEFLRKYDFGDRFIVNIVRTEQNFAYNNLFKNSIFEYAVAEKQNTKEIKVLLIGMNERAFEMLKAILHLGQMPGYHLTVTVIDGNSGWEGVKGRIPEICADEIIENYSDHDRIVKDAGTEGDAIYKLIYIENKDYVSAEFNSIVERHYSDFSFAFIDAGADLLNMDIAMRLNSFCNRKNRGDDYRIQVSIQNYGITRLWNELMYKNIEIVGGIEATYSHSFITMSTLEMASELVHEARHKGSISWVEYCNNEYNRRSVYARTLSLKYKAIIIHDLYHDDDHYDITGEEKWKKYEHMRWNVYTRTLGYVLTDSHMSVKNGKIDSIYRTRARVHNDLVKYDELPLDVSEQDEVDLPETVALALQESDNRIEELLTEMRKA